MAFLKTKKQEITTASIVTPFVELITKLEEHVKNHESELVRLATIVAEAEAKKKGINVDMGEALAIADNLRKLFKQ